MLPEVKILVADDDASVNQLIRAILQDEGWQVYSAGDGEEAVRIINEHHFDLIILDMIMPRMNGLEVCRYVSGLFNTPIIMTSANADQDTRTRCLDAGADSFVPKPFCLAELIRCVKTALAHHNIE